jgi:hypothetical protein
VIKLQPVRFIAFCSLLSLFYSGSLSKPRMLMLSSSSLSLGEHRGSSPSLTPPPEFTRAGSTVSDVSAIETSRVRKKRPKLF